MAVVIRDPRNPLADALGTLSQQILADAASRKEREFRSAEMEKERAFMGSENAAVRELQRTEMEARMAHLKQVAADTRLSDQERTAASVEIARMQREVGMAQAGAAGAQGAANRLLAEGQLEQLRQAARRGDAALRLQAREAGLDYNPETGEFTPIPGMEGQGGGGVNAGIVQIPPYLQQRAESFGVELPPVVTNPSEFSAPIKEAPLGYFGSAIKAVGERGPFALLAPVGIGRRAAEIQGESEALQDTLRQMQANAFNEQLRERARIARGEKVGELVRGLSQ